MNRESGEDSVRVTFELPVGSRYVGPPSTGAGVAEIRESGVRLRFAYHTGFDSGTDFDTDPGSNASGETGESWDTGLDVYEIRSAKFRKGLLRNRLVIEAEDPAATQAIPASEQGTVILKIPRAEAEAARRAETLLLRGLTGRR